MDGLLKKAQDMMPGGGNKVENSKPVAAVKPAGPGVVANTKEAVIGAKDTVVSGTTHYVEQGKQAVHNATKK